MNIVFKETQKFNQVWLWALLLAINVIPVWGIYRQIFRGLPFGNNPAPNWILILFFIFTFSVLFFFWMLQLTTIIDQEGVSIRFYPFTKKRILWSDIQSAEVLNYGFVGGWGIRFGTQYGTVYNTSGNRGLALILKDGNKLCVGTQREEELRNAVSGMNK